MVQQDLPQGAGTQGDHHLGAEAKLWTLRCAQPVRTACIATHARLTPALTLSTGVRHAGSGRAAGHQEPQPRGTTAGQARARQSLGAATIGQDLLLPSAGDCALAGALRCLEPCASIVSLLTLSASRALQVGRKLTLIIDKMDSAKNLCPTFTTRFPKDVGEEIVKNLLTLHLVGESCSAKVQQPVETGLY